MVEKTLSQNAIGEILVKTHSEQNANANDCIIIIS